ncbi:MAG: acyl-[acyl-carrier-protein] thioesterase [Candidatus Coproplasma sp.]
MYLHSKDYQFRYTDADFQDRIRPAGLLSVMQESACLSADELGFGYKVLQPRNIGFILSNWFVELFRPIKYDEVLTVHTWPVKPKKLIVFRDFELFVGDEKVGLGTSRWCVIDLGNFSMLPASAVFEGMNVEYNEFRSTEFNSWKIPSVSTHEPSYTKYGSYSDYDHYQHINNTKYADLLMDAFSVDELRGKWFSQFQISYIKQCKCGEKIDFYKEQSEDGCWIVEGRVGDETRVQFKVRLNED